MIDCYALVLMGGEGGRSRLYNYWHREETATSFSLYIQIIANIEPHIEATEL